MSAGAARRSDNARAVEALVVSHASGLYGAQLHLLRLAPHLAERGVRFTLASPDDDFARAWREAGFAHVPLTLPEHRPASGADSTGRSPRQRVAEAAAVARSVAPIVRLARRFDLLVSYSLTAHLEVALAGRLARRPVVLELVDMVSPGLGRIVLQTAARLATTTVVNSAATAVSLGSVTCGVHVVHPGVDLDRFAPGPVDGELRRSLAGDPDVPLVGIVGRVDPRKGVHVLVEAMSLLEGDAAAARLVVVGDTVIGTPEYADQLRRDATRLLGERVRFVGRRSDVVDVLRCLDVLVNASLAEPFGLSILEAQAAGVAVVGPRSGGVPEFVEEGVTGLLVPPFDAPALAAALQSLLDDPARRRRLAAAGRRRALERHGLERNHDEIASIYRASAERRSSPSTGART